MGLMQLGICHIDSFLGISQQEYFLSGSPAVQIIALHANNIPF